MLSNPTKCARADEKMRGAHVCLVFFSVFNFSSSNVSYILPERLFYGDEKMCVGIYQARVDEKGEQTIYLFLNYLK